MRHADATAKLIVANGYDRIADGFLQLAGKEARPEIARHLDRLCDGLPTSSTVLDLGCGAGIYTRLLSERLPTVGADISGGQLALAAQLASNARLVLADMCALPFRDASFDAISALYSVIHVPRKEHERLLCRMFDLLRPGGRLLAVLGASSLEGTEHDWLGLGAEMYWSHFDAQRSLALVRRAGFHVLETAFESDPLGGEHLFVLAEKPA